MAREWEERQGGYWNGAGAQFTGPAPPEQRRLQTTDGSAAGSGNPPRNSPKGAEPAEETDAPLSPSHALRLRLMMGAYRRGRSFGVLENKLLAHSALSRLKIPTIGELLESISTCGDLPLSLAFE